MFVETPLFYSFRQSKMLKKEIYFKMECFQPTASFKIRGISKLCKNLKGEGIKQFICASGGNAGLAAAYCGNSLGIHTLVIVPETTPENMRKKITEYGAELIVHGKVWNEANELANELTSKNEKAFYIHPFDHPLLWEGHSTIIDEIAEQSDEPDAIVLAVGGGGLFCGVMEGLNRNGWNKTKVICAETEGAASFAKSVKAGEHITLDKIESIASSLGARKISDKAWSYALDPGIIPFVCDDNSAVQSCKLFFDEFRFLTEPACGAALSFVYNSNQLIDNFQKIVVIACGGSNFTMDKII